MQHGGNTPHGGNGQVTRGPTHSLGIGLSWYLRSILLHIIVNQVEFQQEAQRLKLQGIEC